MAKTSTSLSDKIILLFTIGVAAFLRLHQLGGQSLWNDEGNSARLSERSLRLILEGTASDVHPPLYYGVLHFGRMLVGDSEFGLRFFSVIFGLLILPLTYQLVQNSPFPTLILGALAINPAHIYYSQEARMYTLLPLCLVAATLFWQKAARPVPRRVWLIAYAVVLVLGFYTHYFFPIILFIHAIWVGVQYRPIFKQWLAAVAVALLLYSPWLAIMLAGMGGNRGIGQPIGRFLAGLATFLPIGPAWAWQTAPWPSMLLLFTALSLLALVRHPQRLLLLAWLGLPVCALLFLGATDGEFYKFLLFLVPALLWAWQGFGRKIAFLLTLPFLALSLYNLPLLYYDARLQRDDYRGMAQRIAHDNHPNAGIILNAPNQWEVFTYYHREGAPVYPLPTERDEMKTQATLTQLANQHQRLYALYWGDSQQDPQHWVENWLNQHTFKADEQWVGDVRLAIYATAATMGQTVNQSAEFGGIIRLESYAIATQRLHPNDVLQLQLRFTPLAPIPTRYKLFVHIAGADGVPVAQLDREPLPYTSEWEIGRSYEEKIGVLIGEEVPAGEYTLNIGWYATDRLPLADGRDVLAVMQLVLEGE